MDSSASSEASSPVLQQQQLPPPAPQQQPPTPIFSARSFKQLGIFFAGAGFLTWSSLMTRRAVRRRTLAAVPKYFEMSWRPPYAPRHNPEGSLIAVEALHLATLNVLSWGIMMAGGAAFAFDMSSLDDLRARARGQLMGIREGRTDADAEREIEEFVARVLGGLKDEDKQARLAREWAEAKDKMEKEWAEAKAKADSDFQEAWRQTQGKETVDLEKKFEG